MHTKFAVPFKCLFGHSTYKYILIITINVQNDFLDTLSDLQTEVQRSTHDFCVNQIIRYFKLHSFIYFFLFSSFFVMLSPQHVKQIECVHWRRLFYFK